jgi:ABC-2 type transport system ATP-binding protein
VLLCSHLLHQVQRICHRIGIIVRGKLVVQGTPDELGKAILKDRHWNFLVEVEGDRQRIDGLLRELPGIAECESRERGWFIRCTQDVRQRVLELVREHGLALLQLRSEDPTLEEIYLKYFREA